MCLCVRETRLFIISECQGVPHYTPLSFIGWFYSSLHFLCCNSSILNLSPLKSSFMKCNSTSVRCYFRARLQLKAETQIDYVFILPLLFYFSQQIVYVRLPCKNVGESFFLLFPMFCDFISLMSQ